eukprot:TRINITY_DN94497_c0_g1_i1.p1 TRINITY_DN94497_c0_g1~~TRINITY_DN94497_c0_g1_i1.p1  ORF type:complete len:323 (+),score=45.07 TRINITY_DN94497_c0_g1_i1:67-1035(+)
MCSPPTTRVSCSFASGDEIGEFEVTADARAVQSLREQLSSSGYTGVDFMTKGRILSEGDSWQELAGPVTVLVWPSELEWQVRRALRCLCQEGSPGAVGEERSVDAPQLEALIVSSLEELEAVVQIVLDEALSDGHYSHVYADVFAALGASIPGFQRTTECSKPVTSTRMMVNLVQDRFEAYFPHYPQKEDPSRDAALTLVKFVGHLFRRHLLAVKLIGTLVHHLIGIREMGELGHLPSELRVEATCELLSVAGPVLETKAKGRSLSCQFLERLGDLKDSRKAGHLHYSATVRAQIDELTSLRDNVWRQEHATGPQDIEVTTG